MDKQNIQIEKTKMVFFYDSCDPDYFYYMGRDKYENEELLKYGFPEDVWYVLKE